VCLFAKRLKDGKFQWPNVQDGVIRLSAAQLSALLEGLDRRPIALCRRSSFDAAPSQAMPRSRDLIGIL
jgi:transposase